MTNTEKLLLGLGIGGAFFLFAKKAAPNIPPISVPGRAEQRIMDDYSYLIWTQGCAKSVDPAIVAAVMYEESRGDPYATGASGEVGLMQVKPATARSACGVADLSTLADPQVNIGCGARYLAYCIDKFGRIEPGICAYNAGPAAVKFNHGTRKVTAPASSKAYARRVLSRIPKFAEWFRRYPASAANYGWMFPAGKRFFNMETLDGLGDLGQSPRWGYRYNVAQYAAGRRLPGECLTPPRGTGARIGTRQFYQPLGELGQPRWGYRYNVAQYAAGRRLPGECLTPPQGTSARIGTRQYYQPRGMLWL